MKGLATLFASSEALTELDQLGSRLSEHLVGSGGVTVMTGTFKDAVAGMANGSQQEQVTESVTVVSVRSRRGT